MYPCLPMIAGLTHSKPANKWDIHSLEDTQVDTRIWMPFILQAMSNANQSSRSNAAAPVVIPIV